MIKFHPDEVPVQLLREKCKKLKSKPPVERKEQVSGERKQSRTYEGKKQQKTAFGWKYSQGRDVCVILY